jgi:hypothetical protein
MNKLCNRVQGSRIFSKINLKSGYNLIRIKEGDEWKTEFRTCYEHYEYLVMPFRLANTPTIFQNVMIEILWDLINKGVMVYIDNIQIYTHDMKQYEILV